MKIKFFAAAAMAIALVGCNKETAGNAVVENNDGAAAFISVSLKAAGSMTKAAVGTYENGSEVENKINNATFYFFDNLGNAYQVAPETGSNAVVVNSKDLTQSTDETPGSIEAYSDVILVIKSSKQTPPSQMVALINVADPAAYANKTLAELQAMGSALKTGDYFVMSNSTYASDIDGRPVTAAQILPENIFVTPDPEGNVGDAYDAPEGVVPVDVYVERVAAKVRVDVSATADANGNYPVKGQEGTFVKVLGWDITNASADSYLLKKYAFTNLFSPVNNAAFRRSYWAETIGTAAPSHNLAFMDIKNPLKAEVYYHENTLSPTNAEGWFNDVTLEAATEAPQLVIAAQLVDAAGKPKEFAKWYGKDYENGPALKAAMINNAAKQIFVKNEAESTGDKTVYDGISVDDVTFYQIDDKTSYNPADYNDDRRYEVRVKATEGKVYYKQTGATANGEPTVAVMEEDEVNKILGKIEPCMIWTSGMTYYYTLIDHYGNADGMVRNHVYDVKVSGFNGLGTPVYDDTKIVVPEKTIAEEAYYLTAQINVLSWSVVAQEVEVGF